MTIKSRDENFTFLIIDEEGTNHCVLIVKKERKRCIRYHLWKTIN
jgi:hypothetical protein